MGMLMGGAALGAGIFAVIKAASNLEEVESKFSAVFKELTDGARQWADEFATSIGRNRTEVMGFIASLQDTFVPLGFAREESQKMSQGLTQLAYDLASFNPTVSNAGEALSLLTSALVGNHEAVRRFGITITETSLKQKMLALGYEGNAAAASNEMKVLARLAMIYDGTTDAQGDAINTADSFKNRMAELWSIITKVAETIGTALMPVVKALGSVMGAVGGVFQRALDGVLPGVADVIGQISETIEAIADGIRSIDFSKWRSQLGDLVSGVFAIIKAGLAGLWEVFKRLLVEAADWLKNNLISAIEAAFKFAKAKTLEATGGSNARIGLILAGGLQGGAAAPIPETFGDFAGKAFEPLGKAMADFQEQFRQKPSPGG
ncbi:MAG TPA: hypothetical protein VMY42_14540, partial [Thermoguttaceae bacterium]|nr:hypothetical protein [Thermoguttaceae bacterium]